MADLTETTLARPVGQHDRQIALTSASGVSKGDALYFDGEAVIATADPLGNVVPVMRGMLGSQASAHQALHTVFSGTPNRFHAHDPKGLADAAPNDNPWINVPAGRVYRASGDATGPGTAARNWVLVTTTYPVGALGIIGAPVSTP
jgi:hypothetical protein